MLGVIADVCSGKSELLIAGCDKLGNDDVRWAPSFVSHLGVSGLLVGAKN